MLSTHCLYAENMTKEINGRRVLDHLSLSLEGGKVCGVVGGSGAGKTMLIRALAGLVHLEEGRVLLDGREKKDWETEPVIGLLADGAALYPQLTGFQNLWCLAQIRGRADREMVREAMEVMGLEPGDTKRAGRYSPEMMRRLLAAQAIMERPDFLFWDEPADMPGEESAVLFRSQIQKAAARGAVAVITGRSREEIENLCSEIYFMEAGRIGK